MTLCVMLFLTTRVSAGGWEAQQGCRKPRLRAVRVTGRAEEVRVAARTATRIRFDTALDARRTRLEDGLGRFEPLLVGNGFLVVTPREELAGGEHVTLRVVLSDGTEVPFVLATSASEVDVQVRVSRYDAAPRPRQEERRAGQLAESMLVLAARSGPLPPAVPGEGLEVERRVFHAGGLSGFVVRVRNPDPLRSWEPGDVRVRRVEGGGEVEVLALRMGPGSLPPGGWGWLVVVTPALPEDGQARFELELRGRMGVAL
ncbi:MAG TPA: DUF2381 family protein [Archangium sp.]|uniref:DUF2381 family protein n=1 Tax=Archangium sp. TaxID=1872627 RepID=UPI002E2F8425|nr:DUF2381 family protein [Archangium sp.]HEX5745141.1 DUF2381 family protein [Archangium sp.]